MSKKTLLLDMNYQVQAFIPLKKALKHIYKDKVEIISSWSDDIYFSSGKMKHPAVIKLKYPIKRNYMKVSFSRFALVKRDESTCQYCNKKLNNSSITIDHVIPRSHGGPTSFTNCVVSCQICNGKKGNKTLEQVNMVLIKKPVNPSFMYLKHGIDVSEQWHDDWAQFINF